MNEVIEAEAVEVPGELAVIPADTGLAVTPQVKPAELVARLSVIREAAEQAMTENVDFGKVPGTDKPTLLKPGAEKLGVLFQLDVQLENEKTWGPGEHLTVISHATVFHAPSGSRLGYGEGICTTRERKYAYRRANRKCPNCGVEAILLSKDDTEGFFCWRKRDGCGAQFPRDDERITSQEEGEVDNPDLPDLWNTVVKMAEKRARIDAVLAVTGASALFTQDMEPAAGASTDAPRASTPVAVSTKQLDLFTRLLKEAELDSDALTTVLAFADDKLTGGREGTMSLAIDGLMDKEARAETVTRLVSAAEGWATSQSDLPKADTRDLPEAA